MLGLGDIFLSLNFQTRAGDWQIFNEPLGKSGISLDQGRQIVGSATASRQFVRQIAVARRGWSPTMAISPKTSPSESAAISIRSPVFSVLKMSTSPFLIR